MLDESRHKRIFPAKTGAVGKIEIVGVQFGVVFDGQCREVCIRHIRTCPSYLFQRIPVIGGGMQQDDVWSGKPAPHF